jgi:hypothetical protein
MVGIDWIPIPVFWTHHHNLQNFPMEKADPQFWAPPM